MQTAMTEGLIGVIVPVYKVEKYISECIESILAQTYTKFHLILVDDGTPDNAGNICDEYAKKDSRITVIHQENAGVTRARARGVEEADDCEFITFVDGDDTLLSDGLQSLVENSEKYDIVISEVVTNKRVKRFIPNIEYRNGLIYEKHCSLWGKLFRKSIIDQSSFDTQRKIYVGEDLLTNLRISFNTTSDIVIIDKKVYNYRYNEASCINTFRPTLEYEQLFHKVLLETISAHDSTDRYQLSTIKRRLLWWDRLFGYKSARPEWAGTFYHKQLINDIQEFSYPIGTIEYLLLKMTNPIIRYFLINIRKINNLISRTKTI